MMFLVPEDVLD